MTREPNDPTRAGSPVPADGTVLLAGSKTVKKASKKATGGASLATVAGWGA